MPALRAEAIGLDVARLRILALAVAGAAAGLSGAIFTYAKGGVFPTYIAIPHSVEALLMVAKGRALRVVAEGVEHKAQAQLLQAWEPGILCQGYLFSRPLPASEWLQAPDLSGPQALRTW